LLLFFAGKKGRDRRQETKRDEARELRSEARTIAARGERQRAEADEHAARARREQTIAEERRAEAEGERRFARERHEEAREVDPDADAGETAADADGREQQAERYERR
jgi:hypothetical protein